MIYVTPNWHRACDSLANFEWARSVMGQNGPRASRLIRQAKAELRRVEQAEPVLSVFDTAVGA